MKNKLIVANWKMQLPYIQALQFCLDNQQALLALAQHTHGVSLILCPSFEVLANIKNLLNGSHISLGAQCCSPHKSGAYTGQISAESLAQLGCNYCIIGHSERRLLCHESNHDIAQQAIRLIEAGITPILCIGETQQEHDQKTTLHILQEQLDTVLESIGTHSIKNIIIAYEPVWAIGTGAIPSTDHLVQVFSWLYDHCSQNMPTTAFKLLYGGSINTQNISKINALNHIDGFLIGGASLDFQKFENIVSLVK